MTTCHPIGMPRRIARRRSTQLTRLTLTELWVTVLLFCRSFYKGKQ